MKGVLTYSLVYSGERNYKLHINVFETLHLCNFKEEVKFISNMMID